MTIAQLERVNRAFRQLGLVPLKLSRTIEETLGRMAAVERAVASPELLRRDCGTILRVH